MTKFSQRLELALKMNDMRAVDLCRKTGLSSGTISQYRSGRCSPKKDRLDLIAVTLNVSPEWLLGYAPVVPDKSDDEAYGVIKGDLDRLLAMTAGVPDEEIGLFCSLSSENRRLVVEYIRYLKYKQDNKEE